MKWGIEMTTTVVKAHAKAMEHGWNIIKFYGPGYDPTQGEMVLEGAAGRGRLQRRRDRAKGQEDRGFYNTAGSIRDKIYEEEYANPGLTQRETKRMDPRKDYKEKENPDKRALSGAMGGESSFDTEGLGESAFDAPAEWRIDASKDNRQISS